jgi:hypothetical protein
MDVKPGSALFFFLHEVIKINPSEEIMSAFPFLSYIQNY